MEVALDRWKDLSHEDISWVWEGYLAQGHVTVLAAPPKEGKSTLLFSLFKAIQDEEPFLGKPTKRVECLLFTEESRSLLESRKSVVGEELPLTVATMQPGLTWSRVLSVINRQVRENDVKLVVLDTISRFWDVKDENDPVDVLHSFNPLVALCREWDFALLVLHHTRKARGAGGSAIRGSNALLGASDIGLELRRLSPWDRGPSRRLESFSRFAETPDIVTIRLKEDGSGYEMVEEDASLEKAAMMMVTAAGEITAVELSEETGVALRSAQRVLANLTARGVLARTGSGTKSHPYRYTLAPDSS